MSLRTKSLVVLSIPTLALLGSTLAIAAAWSQVSQAQRWVIQTSEVKSLIGRCQQMAARSLSAAKDTWLPVPGVIQRFESMVSEWRPTFQALSDEVSDNPEQLAHLRAILAVRPDQALLALRDYRVAHPESDEPPAALLDDAVRAASVADRELLAMQRLSDRILTEHTRTVRAAELRLLQISLGGAFIGVIGGIVGAVSFSRTISRRVDMIREDSIRLLRGEPLVNAQSSQDEIGELERQLHEMWRLTASRIEELDMARSQLDQFFSVSPDLLCISDLRGRFTKLNPAWHDVLGWEIDDLLSRSSLDFVHPDDVEVTRRDMARQAVRSTAVNTENRFRRKDGTYRWLNWKSMSRPELGLIFAAARDVTEEKRINAELRGRVRDLKEVNDELESFSYSVSHDLRAPLRHITGFNAFVEKSASERLNEQERRWLSQSLSAAQRMGRLIDDLLSFSKMGRTPLIRSHVRLDALIREAIDEVIETREGGPEIAWSIEALPAVRADGPLLRQAFVNLIGNAVKYTRHRPQPRIEIGSRAGDDGDVVVFVRDNGVGFDMQYVHKLFGVFQRLHAADEFEGTGIGLASVRRIISKHGGHVWAEGILDRGATFYVSLPALDGGTHS